MGKITAITYEQEIILDKFRDDFFLSANFYFSGGTALSLYYLRHRQSIDLDFFSESTFDPQTILNRVSLWAESLNVSVGYVPIEDTHVFNLRFPNKQTVKVDFAYYPYKQIEKSLPVKNINVDSMLDIAVNKMLAVQQRTEVKDFVDLYFLLQKFSTWDLIEGVRVKFKVELEPFVAGSDFLKAEGFDFLPKMIKPLKLDLLKAFFKKQAKILGGASLE